MPLPAPPTPWEYIGFYGNRARHRHGQNSVTSLSAERKCNLNNHFAMYNDHTSKWTGNSRLMPLLTFHWLTKAQMTDLHETPHRCKNISTQKGTLLLALSCMSDGGEMLCRGPSSAPAHPSQPQPLELRKGCGPVSTQPHPSDAPLLPFSLQLSSAAQGLSGGNLYFKHEFWSSSVMQKYIQVAACRKAGYRQQAGRVQYPCEYEDNFVLLFSRDEDSPRETPLMLMHREKIETGLDRYSSSPSPAARHTVPARTILSPTTAVRSHVKGSCALPTVDGDGTSAVDDKQETKESVTAVITNPHPIQVPQITTKLHSPSFLSPTKLLAAFLSDIGAGFALLCTNGADAISAETRDRQNNKSICSRTIKDLLQLEVESQTSQLGVITDQYPLQIGHRCGHATTGQCVTQTQHVDKPCLECLQPEQATEAGEEQGEQKVAS
ncbi:hypothetical protein Anapl_09034 [Anas platyrhynchos]|uniref:Uncharacterized protein n=1 Tax=Anas platyrhynchos TaxID=8839 RepID=R0JJG2_ANAPL|nr:hypothetical protein Anapl_09034 [Anas platyrhynchos]